MVALALSHLNMSELPEPIMGSGNCNNQVHILDHYPQNSRQIPPGSKDPWSPAQKWSQDAEVVSIMTINEIQDTQSHCKIAHLGSVQSFSISLQI